MRLFLLLALTAGGLGVLPAHADDDTLDDDFSDFEDDDEAFEIEGNTYDASAAPRPAEDEADDAPPAKVETTTVCIARPAEGGSDLIALRTEAALLGTITKKRFRCFLIPSGVTPTTVWAVTAPPAKDAEPAPLAQGSKVVAPMPHNLKLRPGAMQVYAVKLVKDTSAQPVTLTYTLEERPRGQWPDLLLKADPDNQVPPNWR